MLLLERKPWENLILVYFEDYAQRCPRNIKLLIVEEKAKTK